MRYWEDFYPTLMCCRDVQRTGEARRSKKHFKGSFDAHQILTSVAFGFSNIFCLSAHFHLKDTLVWIKTHLKHYILVELACLLPAECKCPIHSYHFVCKSWPLPRPPNAPVGDFYISTSPFVHSSLHWRQMLHNIISGIPNCSCKCFRNAAKSEAIYNRW